MTKHNLKNPVSTASGTTSEHMGADANYRVLFEYAPDGILVANAKGQYLDANPSICKMLGYARYELIGMNATDIVAQSEITHIEPALAAIQAKADYMREWQLRRKNGTLFSAEIMATTMPDGNILAMVRDISLIKQQQHEINQLTRLHTALTKVNQAIIWLPDRTQLFNTLCHILVNEAGFKMAWVAWHNPKTKQLEPAAACGDDTGFLNTISVYTDDRPGGQGPTGRAFRTEKACICNNMQDDPGTQIWRDEIIRRGFKASAAFPIRANNKVCGTISVYADQLLFFQHKQLALLQEAADNISFALENFNREEKRRQAELNAENESLFSDMMIESMPGILYFYNHSGKFLRWNHNFRMVTGYSDEEISKMHPLDFFAEDEKATIAEKIQEVFTAGQAFVEAGLRAKDGSKTPYLFTGRNVRFKGIDCLVGMGIDISERKNALSKLNESELKYRELVESANSIILRWNAQGCVTFLNTFGLQFFGYEAEDIIGKPIVGTIVPATDSAGHDLQGLMNEICLDTKKFEQNVNENMRRNGERVWISWTNKVVLDEHGKVVEILSIGNDITDSLEAERKILELNVSLEKRVEQRTEELQAALVRAEAADKIKSAFLATMSHELRTPLNSIIGFTGIILQGLAGPLNAEQTKQLSMVRGSAKHLLELINDVLDISKIEAGQLDVRAEPFNLMAMIERVSTLLAPVAEKKGLLLHTHIKGDLGDIISDRRRLEQILINLINNAIKFTESGSVTVTAELLDNYRISPHAAPARYVRLIVADTGIGIKPEDLALLFQPFRQIDSGLSRMHEGTGLGLAICKRLLELMGGQITANSVWSQGSEFVVLLPLQGEIKS